MILIEIIHEITCQNMEKHGSQVRESENIGQREIQSKINRITVRRLIIIQCEYKIELINT